MASYEPGSTAYIVNGNFIEEGTVLRCAGDLCDFRPQHSFGAIRIRLNRLYPTLKEAQAALRKKKPRTWHD